ncbi:Actin-binding LIM protein 2 [Taenia solium]|eukprot:TsM_000126100 transcript=TsM_000126100 gene=TsM_000126100
MVLRAEAQCNTLFVRTAGFGHLGGYLALAGSVKCQDVCLCCGQKCLIPFYQLKDGIFHLEFCNVDLHNKPYFVLSGKLVCYDDIKTACCHTCQTVIKGDRIITQFGNFHKECFQCSKCGTNFTPASKFYIGARKFFCHECCISLKSSSYSRRVKPTNKTKDSPAQFKAVERHVVTSSRCEIAANEMEDEEKEPSFFSNQLKLKHERPKKKEPQGAEVGTLSQQPKLKRPKKPLVCTLDPFPDISRISLIGVGLQPKDGSYSPHSLSYSNQGFNQVESSDRTSSSKCSTRSKLQVPGDSVLSGREEILRSPAIGSSPPPPASSPPFNNNQELSQEPKSVSSNKDSELNPQLAQATHRKTKVNALVMAYEKITTQTNEHLNPNASATDQNSSELLGDKIEGTKFCGSQPTFKLPIQVIPQNSPALPVCIAQEPRSNGAAKGPSEATTRFGRVLLLILSIVATPISILLYLQNWITPSVPGDRINLQSLGIEIADDAIQLRTSN